MRLFIAIHLSDAMKNVLIDAQDQMYSRGIRGRYTSEENLHLTLAFIGEYPDPEAVIDALSGVSLTPFDITLEGMGCFGKLWWAGIKESSPLAAVSRRTRRALAENGIPFDRKKFSAHITLIRKASGEMPGIQIPPVSMTVNAISLMRSERGKNGMIYTEIGKINAAPQDHKPIRQGSTHPHRRTSPGNQDPPFFTSQ